MRYINAILGSLIALIIFSILSYLTTGRGASDDIKIILTVSSFLFAILAGFFISRLNSRYDKVRELIASEDAHWLSLYKVSSFYGKEFLKKITELIDEYYIVLYDSLGGIGDEYKYNSKYFLSVYDVLKNIEKYRGEGSFQKILDDLVAIENTRNTRAVLVLEKITKGQWAILISLAFIIIFSVFSIQIPTLYSGVVTVLLSTVVILVLLMIRDLQNLRLGGQLLAIESGEEIFEYIGKLRYYNKKYLDDGSVVIPKYIKHYRIGFHKLGEEPKIKTVHR